MFKTNSLRNTNSQRYAAVFGIFCLPVYFDITYLCISIQNVNTSKVQKIKLATKINLY